LVLFTKDIHGNLNVSKLIRETENNFFVNTNCLVTKGVTDNFLGLLICYIYAHLKMVYAL